MVVLQSEPVVVLCPTCQSDAVVRFGYTLHQKRQPALSLPQLGPSRLSKNLLPQSWYTGVSRRIQTKSPRRLPGASVSAGSVHTLVNECLTYLWSQPQYHCGLARKKKQIVFRPSKPRWFPRKKATALRPTNSGVLWPVRRTKAGFCAKRSFHKVSHFLSYPSGCCRRRW